MDRWEYKTVRTREVGVNVFRPKVTAERIDECFNELGRQGWEMVQFHFQAVKVGGILAVLKRRRS